MKPYKFIIKKDFFDKPTLAFFVIEILVMIFVYVYIGLLLMAVTVIPRFFKEGFEIDYSNMKYRILTQIFGVSLGKWKDLPKVKYISIVKVNESVKSYQSSHGMYANKQSGEKSYKLNLILESKKRFITLCMLDKNTAFKTAMEIGESFNLNVLDVTKHEKQWLR